jgi:hypothetical protein
MATPTYTLIDSVTLGSSATTVTFASIPQNYRDLILVADYSLSAANRSARLTLNNDTTNKYFWVTMVGDGSSAYSQTASNQYYLDFGYLTDKTLSIIQFLDYSATDKHKSTLARTNNPGDEGAQAYAGRWASTSAITEIDLFAGSADYSTGSTFYLYGIEA